VDQLEALGGQAQLLDPAVPGILGALHKALPHEPLDQLAGCRGARLAERADIRDLALACVEDVQQGMDLRPGQPGLVREVHEVLDDMRQDVFETGVCMEAAHVVYVPFIVNYDLSVRHAADCVKVPATCQAHDGTVPACGANRPSGLPCWYLF